MNVLLPACTIPKVVSKDGYAGQNSFLNLPFPTPNRPLYFFDGRFSSFPGGTIPQNPMLSMNGLTQVPTFKKDCCSCFRSPTDMTYTGAA